MLDAFRKRSNSTIIYLAFGAIIIIFAFGFGASGSVCSPHSPGDDIKNVELVEVNGTVIDTQLLNAASELSVSAPAPQGRQDSQLPYLLTRFQYLELDGPYSSTWGVGDGFMPSGYLYGRPMQEISPIKDLKVLDELIETRVVADYARSIGMSVSNDELNTRLARLQARFRDATTGEFNRKNFNGYLAKSLQMTSPTFEAFVKDVLLRERVIALLVGEIDVTDAEVEADHALKGDKVKIEVISVDKASAQPLVPVTDAEVQTWIAANADKVKDEYEKKKALEFTTPKTFNLRVIKLSAPSLDEAGGDDAAKANITEERKTVKAKADQALTDLKAKLAAPAPAPDPEHPDVVPAAPTPFSTFAEVAKTVSDDDSKDNDAKWPEPVAANKLGRDPFGPAVAAAASTFVVGQPSDVLETKDAFWILMPETITEEIVKTLDEAKPIIAKNTLQGERVEAFMKTLADEVKAEAAKDPKQKLEVVAAAINAKYNAPEGKGLKAKEVNPFARLDPARYISGIGKAPELGLAAFKATAENPLLPDVYKATGDNLIIGRFLETVPHEPLTDDEKKAQREGMRSQRRSEIYRGWYDDYLAKLKLAGDYEEKPGFADLKKRLEESYVNAGGTLPGMEPKKKPAAGGLDIQGLPPGVKVIQGGGAE